MRRGSGLSAAQQILLAAAELHAKGVKEFTEWDLTIQSWKLDPNRFGCRGYETKYPDHKRVMMEIMGKSKTDNPVRRGWIKRTKPNHYKITPVGLAQAGTLSQGDKAVTSAARSNFYDAIIPYIENRHFQSYKLKHEVPNMWLSVEAFYGITSLAPDHVIARIDHFEDALKLLLSLISSDGGLALTRGPVGGGKEISEKDIRALESFHGALLERFKGQFAVLRKPKKLS